MTQNRGAIDAVDSFGSMLANVNSRLGALEVVAHTPCTCANCITVCTSTTRPSSPFDGQTIYETNTDNYMTWNGSAWVGMRAATLTTAAGAGLYVDTNNVPRYAQQPNVYGWHATGEQVGTQTVIGAWGANGMGWSAANAWITVGSVGITIPTGSSVIVMHYGFTMFVQGGGGFLVRVYYNGGATAVSDFQYFRNNTFDHFAVVGPRGLGIQPGTSGTIFLQVYGQGITLTSDANDSGYFVVTTV